MEYREANKWYLSSAESGLSISQFAIGKNMVRGRGCEVDEKSGMKWIKAAALGGYSPAQQYLARSMVADSEKRLSATAITWLKNAAESGYYPSKLLLAWELSTSSDTAVDDGAQALALLHGDRMNYYDEVRVLETKAAAYAKAGDFKSAVKKQKKALSKARKAEWEIPVMVSRLTHYQSKQEWRGSYYVSDYNEKYVYQGI